MDTDEHRLPARGWGSLRICILSVSIRGSESFIVTAAADPDLAGLIPATVTPLTSDFSLDLAALRSYIRWLKDFDGLKALAVNMDTGEGPHLSREERRQVLETCADEVRGQMPLLAGIAARYTAEAVEMAHDAASAGATGLVVFPIPVFVGGALPPKAPYEYHAAIARATDLPLILFQLQPALGGVIFAPDTLSRLLEIDQVVAIKEASFDRERFLETARLLAAAPRRIALLTGNDNFILESFLSGTDGALIGMGTVAVAEQVEMIRRAKAGDVAGARRISEAVVAPLAEALFANPVRNYRARIKEALRLLDVLPNAAVRPPLLPLDETELCAVADALSGLKLAAPVPGR
jgi:4-hydroxy-tetrahydrodipicolinate synthase